MIDSGPSVEVKNMNSFNAMSRAVDFEIERQTTLYRAGKDDDVIQAGLTLIHFLLNISTFL